MTNKSFAPVHLCVIILFFAFTVFAQTRIPEPKDVLGFTPGDDKKLASWAKIVEYFQKLDAASDRVMFEWIGSTTEGRPFARAIISSPENLKKLDYYKDINNKLADPRLIGRNDKTAGDLIKNGKTFVVITHGIHSTEVGSTLSSTLIAHRLASSNDPLIKKILDETIIVMVPSLNPDGVDIVKNWYDKTLGTKFEGTSPPELYHKYVGHDNNRDWYAFTQVETQLTVEKVHNEFHPQIVHDIHQQGQTAARFFIPPYEPPVEPNVPQQLIEGYTEIGNFIAREMREDGFAGITNNTTYDAWTPARAYSHYHGGVRILSETASADLASPIEVKFETLRGRRGFDAKKDSKNFGPVWKGGSWGMRDITNYMTTGAFKLLEHAAANRKAWLKRFYEIGKEATRPRKEGEVYAYIIDERNSRFNYKFQSILERAGVEIKDVGKFTYEGKTYPDNTSVILMEQPYAGFATAMIEPQKYPDLIDEDGQPIPPYDVTAHNLALLTDTKLVRVMRPFKFPKEPGTGGGSGTGSGGSCPFINYRATYRSSIPSMDEGWTRWVIEDNSQYHQPCTEYISIKDGIGTLMALEGNRFKSIIFPDQSPDQILEGYREGSMPEEYTGGIGAEGVKELKQFVEAGGTLVFLNRSTDFAIKQFDLPVKDVTDGLDQKDFYIPGSILRIKLDPAHPLAKDMPAETIAWFERSPAFEILDESRVKVIARYPEKPEDILLSGWALGAEKLAGKAALVEVQMGEGKIILFGFRPQYRGQSLATFPLLFNSIAD